MNELRAAFHAVLEGRSLNAVSAERAIGEMLDLELPEALVAGFLIALRAKGETAAELTGGALAMRARARRLDLRAGAVLDTAGTGGDGASTFNISTGAALVAAAAGVAVAKHGNRAASGTVGAADALEAMGITIELEPEKLERCLERTGFCFIFAPAYHPALSRLAALRRALGVGTLFNLIAPLANPAFPRRQLLGVSRARLVAPISEAAAALGLDHALVVHGHDGLDEISVSGPTTIAEVRSGAVIATREVSPGAFGMATAGRDALRVNGREEAIAVLRAALGGTAGPAHDAIALNAGAAIYAGGEERSLAAGVERARRTLEAGAALELIEKLRRVSAGA